VTQDYYGTKRITAWRSPKMIEVGGEKVIQEGYAVKYVDGYISWSPKDVFEAAYQPITAMSFGHAIEALKAGHKVCRAGWNGKGLWLDLQVPDEHSKMSLPYIYMFTADKHQVPWLASQTDVLANDWMIVGAPVEES
jgi:hypothetical protein